MRSSYLSFCVVLSFSALAQAEPTVPFTLSGLDHEQKPCSLTVESWEFESGQPREWFHLNLRARSHWQLAGNPSLHLTASATSWALYGSTKENYDRVALYFQPG